LKVAFAGTPEFAVPALRALVGSAHVVVGVLTQPDRPRGRGRHVAPSPVKEIAIAHGLPLSQPASLKAAADRQDLLSWAPDVLVVVAYGLLLPDAVLGMPRLGCVNIHPSVLPRWRGAAPIQRALLAGDVETGVTIMQMDAGLDTGPMLLMRRTPIAAAETAGALHDRLAQLGGALLLEALDGLAQGTLAPQPQPAEGVCYAAKIDKSEGRIDWSCPAQAIDRQVRAFNPWPVAETRLPAAEAGQEGEPLRVHAARVAADGGSGTPGTVVEVAAAAVIVQCGSGRLALLSVQRSGRRVVAATDLANSLPLLGERLGP
jgi:methionyl-tRNA formyltransferase